MVVPGAGLSAIRHPEITFLLYGDRDVRSPLNVAEDLHARIPSSRLVVIPGVGHLCDVEGGERFNLEVRTFLRSADA